MSSLTKKEWSLKDREYTGWVRIIDDAEIESVSIDGNLKLQPNKEIRNHHFEKDSREMYLKSDIDILREKLIEDIAKAIDNHFKAWEEHNDNIQEKHELGDIVIYEIINKRFGID